MTNLEKLIESKGITMTCKYGAPDNDSFKDSDGWTCILHNSKKQMTVNFYMGRGHHGKEPRVADVLNSLLLDSSALDMDFEDFCGNFGYNTDSRKAEKIYKDCLKSGRKLQSFLGDDFEEFIENNDY